MPSEILEAPADSLSRFIKAMRERPAAEFQTSEAAATFGVTPFGFIRAFKKLTGLSPQRFRAALRIERAKRLLVETDRPVTEISFDVGYNSLGTFVRTFTALVGISPRQLRRLARGDEPDKILGRDRFRPRTSADLPVVRAALQLPLPRAALLAAGLFPQALPAGRPFDGCFIDPDSPRFSLARPPGRRRLSLLVAAIGSFSIEKAWAGRLVDVEVASHSFPASPSPDEVPPVLRLRPLRDTDPPFLTPVPLLMLLQSGRERLEAASVERNRSKSGFSPSQCNPGEAADRLMVHKVSVEPGIDAGS